MQEFQAQRAKEAAELQKEIDNEWESRLVELTKKFDDGQSDKKRGHTDKVVVHCISSPYLFSHINKRQLVISFSSFCTFICIQYILK